MFHDALQSAPNKQGDEESNPYLNKSSVKKSQRKLSKEERKSKPLRKDSVDEYDISKKADERVSNAVTISNKLTSKMKDMFIKKILKEEEAIPEDLEEQKEERKVGDTLIEMTRQSRGGSDPLLNPLLELDDQRI